MRHAQVAIELFTDPACPFAFSAEPHRLRLRWLFADQLDWRVTMIAIAKSREENVARGLEPAMIAEQAARLADTYGMPLWTDRRDAVPASLPACRAVVAVRRGAPERETAFIRRLRVLAMSGGGMIDEAPLIEQAAAEARIPSRSLRDWIDQPDTASALEDDLRRARDPSPAARALASKLGRAEVGLRYTPPSYIFSTDRSYVVPGMQSSLAYETALANLAPGLTRRPPPDDVAEVLEWADHPLATQEVAEICEIERGEARARLTTAGATETPMASDGYWSL